MVFIKRDVVKVLRTGKFIWYETHLLDVEQTPLGTESCHVYRHVLLKLLNGCVVMANREGWVVSLFKDGLVQINPIVL